jgi:uncharacterized membrane protein YkvA (DUF1232 family)
MTDDDQDRAAQEPQQYPRGAAALRALLAFLPDVLRLLVAVARDPRVPRSAKAVAAAAVAYVASPIDLVPDVIPVLGQLDDLWVLRRALRHLAGAAGYDVLLDLWPGSDDGFAVLLVAAGVRS